MKKKLLVVILILTAFLTACNKAPHNSEESNATVGESEKNAINSGNIKKVTENYNVDFDACRTESYTKLDWSQAKMLPISVIEKCYDIERYKSDDFSYDCNKEKQLTQKEAIIKFEEYCIAFFGECVQDGMLFDSDPLIEVDEELPHGIRAIPKVYDYKDKIENNELSLLYLEYRNYEKQQYLLWTSSMRLYPGWFNKGLALKLWGSKEIVSMRPSDFGEPLERYYNDGTNNDVKYMLNDGEVSIGEAINYVENDFVASLKLCDEESKLSVKYVDVYKLNDETYGYCLHFSKCWNEISLEYMEAHSWNANFGGMGSSPYSLMGEAFMVKKDDVDIAVSFLPTYVTEVGEPIENILSLKNAADILEEELSDNIRFKIISTEFIYHGEDGDKVLLKPTWKFTAYNPNDDLYYNFYVDAVCGDLKYFVYSLI